ncbi:hypothetical protein [Cupriavidus sp. EM10]|uniref:hypothetical protein n=1 Tax=Cupriavidus sp. EM10 TaxID=2839983 RepID=UPI001CEC3C10|nr:hypothetical protein [Cupriavidus sp. EM10]
MSENLNWEHGYDHVGLDGVSGDRGDLSDPRDVHRWLESFDCSNLFKDLDAFDLSDSDGDGEMAPVGDEEATGLARPFSEELALAALSNIPNAGTTQKRRKEDYLRNLTEEDFEEGVERLCYRIVKANVEALFDKRTKPDQLVKAAQWLFGRTLGEVNFERCCETLGTRKDVLRLRIHYEFWRRWLVLPVEFPFMIDPVPDAVEGRSTLSQETKATCWRGLRGCSRESGRPLFWKRRPVARTWTDIAGRCSRWPKGI